MADRNTYISLVVVAIIAVAGGAVTTLFLAPTTETRTVTTTVTTTMVTTTSVPPSSPEGGLVIYSTIDPEDFEVWQTAFKAKYPGIAIQYLQDRPGNIYTRIVTEKDAGQLTVDVVIITLPLQLNLQDEGLLEVYEPPEAAAFPDVFKDPDGFWVATSLLPVVQVYNTELVSLDQLPKTIDELVDTKWKGTTITYDITLGTTGTNWLASFKDVLGETQFTKLIEGLANNVQPVRERSFSGTPRMVASGEYSIGLTSYMHDLISNKAAGAPIEMFRVEGLPIGTTLLPISLVTNAEHPSLRSSS